MNDQGKNHRIHNWPDYNRALVNRGSLTIWFEGSPEKLLETQKTGLKGRPRMYSDQAILCALVIRAAFHLPLRALRGFLWSPAIHAFAEGLLAWVKTSKAYRKIVQLTLFLTQRESKFMGKANGKSVNMAKEKGANGERCTWEYAPTPMKS